MNSPFQQFNQQVQKRLREGGYARMKERQRQEEINNRDFSKYPQKKSVGFANIIWILAVGFIIYFLLFSH